MESDQLPRSYFMKWRNSESQDWIGIWTPYFLLSDQTFRTQGISRSTLLVSGGRTLCRLASVGLSLPRSPYSYDWNELVVEDQRFALSFSFQKEISPVGDSCLPSVTSHDSARFPSVITTRRFSRLKEYTRTTTRYFVSDLGVLDYLVSESGWGIGRLRP